ncbi:hypothetical protein QBC36DRAFT_249036 [Triangularia setosa]|uniref:Uncharacterized protein n=1 Tax=Triangularia setosa TaxID=2587417 RepID=A0AAN7A1E7_9PEZI|nr:hypothetical protein QBC36DRAFT_249036 [Podospora setosa]
MNPDSPPSMQQQPASKNVSGRLWIPLPTEPVPMMCIDCEINGHPITALASIAIETSIISLELAEQLSLSIRFRELRNPISLPNGTTATGDGIVQVDITRRHHEKHDYLPKLQSCDVLPGSVYPLVLGVECLMFFLQAVPYVGDWYRLLSPNPPPFDFKIRMSMPEPPLGARTVLLSVAGHMGHEGVYLGGDLDGDTVPALLDGASTCCIISGRYARHRGMKIEELGPEETYTLLFIDGSTAACSMVVRGVEWIPWDNSGLGYRITGRTSVIDFLVVDECPAMVVLGNNYIDAFQILKEPESRWVPDLVHFQIPKLDSTQSLDRDLSVSQLSKGTGVFLKLGDTWLKLGQQAGLEMVERERKRTVKIKAEGPRAVEDSSSENPFFLWVCVYELTMR